MKGLKDKWRNRLTAVIILLNSLALTAAADETIVHKVITNVSDIAVISTDRGEKFNFKDCYFLEDVGAPEVPYKIVRLALPPNTQIGSIEASGFQIESIARGVDHTWFEGDIKTDIYEQYIPAPKDTNVYSSSNLYPGKYIEVLDKGMMGSQSFVTIAVYPIQYHPINKEIILVGEIDFTITLEDNSDFAYSRTPVGAGMLREMVSNPAGFSSPKLNGFEGGGIIPGEAAMGIGVEYVIITSVELAPAFYPYAVWKNQKGLITQIVLIEDILQQYSGEDDAARLRSYLMEAYEAGAQWALLGGDENIIPVRYAYPGNVSTPPALHHQQATELYYADLTGNWDTDGDGIYGEYNHDDPDIYPEVYVGRVPASNSEEAEIWVEKALLYEQNPGNGDYSYLTKGLFICNDQMRDLNEHVYLAELMPDNFEVDISSCIEEPSGGSPNPTQPTGQTVINTMDEGWGFVSNLNHGGFYYYAAMTPNYNHAPRSNVWGDTIDYDDGSNSSLTRLAETDKYGVHYSISCYTGAYDFDSGVWGPGPFITNTSFMEAYLFLPDRGGVAFLGNTRWGWVTSSYLLEKKFIEYVYSDTARHLAVAEALSKIYYPNKRDIGYGHNLYGDPEMIMWANQPELLSINVPNDINIRTNSLTAIVNLSGNPVANAKVCFWKPGEIYIRGYTDDNGMLDVPIEMENVGEIYVTATGIDMIPAMDTIHVHYVLDIDDEPELPRQTMLYSNYPNPFNSATEINFSLVDPGQVKVEIFDISGRLVKTLADNYYPAGSYSLNWNSRNEYSNKIASGTYLYRLRTADKTIVKKMVLLK